MVFTGQTDGDMSCLSTNTVCLSNGSPDNYNYREHRRNIHEAALMTVEDERFEFDMAVEMNAATVRFMEPVAEEVGALYKQEERDGQPAGRLQYQLRTGTFLTSHLSAISRVYGEHGNEVLQHLSRNPLVAVPIILRRLKQKDSEWREVRRNLIPKWKDITRANYPGSLDVTCYFYKREIEKTFALDVLFEELKKARVFLRKPRHLSPALSSVAPTVLAVNYDESACLVQPHLRLSVPGGEVHKYAYELLSAHIGKIARNNTDRERASRIWAEFMVPFFGMPHRWCLPELRDVPARADRSSCVVRYAAGQSVLTLFGVGEVLQLREGGGGGYVGTRYTVRLPNGHIGILRPSAIVHALPGKVQYARQGGYMDVVGGPAEVTDDQKVLSKEKHLFFGTTKIYVFLRMYCLLVRILLEARKAAEKTPSSALTERVNFKGLIRALESVMKGKINSLEYETKCRAVMKDKTYLLAALPKLVEKCSEFFLKVTKEDLVLPLYDFSQLKHMDPVLIRTQCLSVTGDAHCRIQYHPKECVIFFSYLPGSDELLLTSLPDDIASSSYEIIEGKRTASERSGTDRNQQPLSKRLKLKV